MAWIAGGDSLDPEAQSSPSERSLRECGHGGSKSENSRDSLSLSPLSRVLNGLVGPVFPVNGSVDPNKEEFR